MTFQPLAPFPTPPLDDPDDDDRLIGRVLSRREVLALMGVASVGVVAAACAPGAVGSSSASATMSASASAAAIASATTGALPACVVVPELTEGPYYVDEKLERSDIRIDTADGAAVDGAVAADRLGRLAGGRVSVHPARGRPRGRLALRRARELLGRPGRGRTRLPARLRPHGRERQGDDHDHLPRLVHGSRGPHPLQDPDRSGRSRPASNSRHSSSSTTRSASRSMPRNPMPRRARPTSRTRVTASSSRAKA